MHTPLQLESGHWPEHAPRNHISLEADPFPPGFPSSEVSRFTYQQKEKDDEFLDLALKARDAGEFIKSQGLLTQALVSARLSGNSEKIFDCEYQLGLSCWNLAQISQSESFFKLARLTALKLQSEEKIRIVDMCLRIHVSYAAGKKNFYSGRFEKAEIEFKTAIDLADELSNLFLKLKCMRWLSLTCWNLAHYELFYTFSRQALNIAEEIQHNRELGKLYINLGLYWNQKLKYTDSLIFFKKAYQVAKLENSHQDVSASLMNMSWNYTSLGDYDSAISSVKEALELDLFLGNQRLVSMDLNHLGVLFSMRGGKNGSNSDLDLAVDYLKKSLGFARSMEDADLEMRVLNNIGFTVFKQSDFSSALEYLRQALAIANESGDSSSKAMILNNQAHTQLSLGEIESALAGFIQARILGQEMRAHDVLWETNFGLGQCHESLGRNIEALDCYKKALQSIDVIGGGIAHDRNKIGYFCEKFEIYECLIDLLFRMYSIEPNREISQDLFFYLEKAKARVLSESLGGDEYKIARFQNTPEISRYMKLSEEIVDLYYQLSSSRSSSEKERIQIQLTYLEGEFVALSKLLENNPGIEGSLFHPCSLSTFQSKGLDETTLFLGFFLGNKRSFVYAVGNEYFGIHPLAGKESIRVMVKLYLKLLNNSNLQEFFGQKAGRRIFDELIPPESILLPASIKKITFSPDGILNFLPFESLQCSKKGAGENFLIHHYQVAYSPSATTLMSLKAKGRDDSREPSLLAFGNPEYRISTGSRFSRDHYRKLEKIYQEQGFRLTDLPGTIREIKAISRVFDKSRQDIFMGKNAREQVLRNSALGKYRIVHFACHGLLNERNPNRSALVLTLDPNPSSGDDGLLRQEEIRDLKFNASLVVLSSCRSALGRIELGEGVIGLPRVFLYAGVNSVVSSLWNIDDKVTAFFMQKFYQNLAGGRSVSQALRQSKLEMLKTRYFHPFYWAPFIFIGDHSQSIGW